ncbi:hypothetical protein HPB48_019506 [Haemaphysalis longicornis]|uniref:Uncharacterized protein n=1 Tax=Haemaphysalis longicornis TaxID=44386 RepID=A0A9J6FDN4_HAELO|nr:hypothetical protein HPB48_019506 [Haemaphysalis longicornis]
MDSHEYAEDVEGHMQDSDERQTGKGDDDGWQRIHLPIKRPTRTGRVSRTRYTRQFRPLNKIRICRFSRQATAPVIESPAPSAQLAEMAAVTFDDASNSVHIALYDEYHATRLAQIDHLTPPPPRHNGKVETIYVTGLGVLLQLVNQLWDSGEVSDSLPVTVVPESGQEPRNPQNLRPIALTPLHSNIYRLW